MVNIEAMFERLHEVPSEELERKLDDLQFIAPFNQDEQRVMSYDFVIALILSELKRRKGEIRK